MSDRPQETIDKLLEDSIRQADNEEFPENCWQKYCNECREWVDMEMIVGSRSSSERSR